MHIDVERTGLRLKQAVQNAGYDVKTVQEYLQLSCPQPIYRWFKGKLLPSVDHLLALSLLLHVRMEDLLVLQSSKELVVNDMRVRLAKKRFAISQRENTFYLKNDRASTLALLYYFYALTSPSL